MTVTLAIGTRKGLFLARLDDPAPQPPAQPGWTLTGPDFPVQEVPAIGFVTPAPGAPTRILAGVRSEFWGTHLHRSDDEGKSWQETEDGSVVFPDDTGAALARIWQLQGDPARPGVVWAGCEPTSLWHSTDGGATFSLVRGLWDHPHRPNWHPGAGGAAVHTILPDPADPSRLLVAMSTGGVYQSTDAAASWTPTNRGIRADFLPDAEPPEYGQCVHKVAPDAEPGRYFLQNHGGVYRSDDNGQSWTSIGDALPSDFGFNVLTHPRRSGTAWVIPLAGMERIPPGGRLRLHRTTDGGATWVETGQGLPDQAWNAVLRDAATVLDLGPDREPLLAVGTRDGCVYVSLDGAETFQQVAGHLPDVLCLRAAEVVG